MVLFGIINHQTRIFFPPTQIVRGIHQKQAVVNTTIFSLHFLSLVLIKALSLPRKTSAKL